MKTPFRRYIALLTALVLCFSLLPAEAFAGEETMESEPVDITSFSEQETYEEPSIELPTEPVWPEGSEPSGEPAWPEGSELPTEPAWPEEPPEGSEPSGEPVWPEGSEPPEQPEVPDSEIIADVYAVRKIITENNEHFLIELPKETVNKGEDYSFLVRTHDMSEAQLSIVISIGEHGQIYPADDSPVVMIPREDELGVYVEFFIPSSAIDGDISVEAHSTWPVNCRVKFLDNYNTGDFERAKYKSFEFTSTAFIPGTYSAGTHTGEAVPEQSGFSFEILELPIYMSGSSPNVDGTFSDDRLSQYHYDFTGTTMGGEPVAVTPGDSYSDSRGFHQLYNVNGGEPLTGDVIIKAKLVLNSYDFVQIGEFESVLNRETYTSNGLIYATGRTSAYPTYRYLFDARANAEQTRKVYVRVFDVINGELKIYPYSNRKSPQIIAQVYGDYVTGPIILKALSNDELDVFVQGRRADDVFFPYNTSDCRYYNGCIAKRGEDFVFTVPSSVMVKIKAGYSILAEGKQYFCISEGNDRKYTIPGEYMTDDILISTETVSIIADGTCGDDLTWTLTSDGVLEISGTGAMADYTYGNAPWRSFTSSIKSVKIGSGVTTIGDCAFYWCMNMTDITMPDSITVIGGCAFESCRNLTDITLGSGVISIGIQAFYYCTSLMNITIPDSVIEIKEGAFTSCTNLAAIDVAEQNHNYSSEDGVLFNKNKSTLIQYPSGKTGAYTIPDSVTVIGESAFQSCASLTDITIPDSVTTISNSAFMFCIGLSNVTIPDSVKEIGALSFLGCSNLNCLKIGSRVVRIGGFAFSDCTSLTSVTIPDNVTTIDNQAFSRCTSLTAINVSEQNSYYASEDGVLFNKGKSTLLCCPGGKTGEYSIPESVIEISDGAFSYCTGLTGVTIPDSVAFIGNNAFENCTGLTGVTIPESVTYIGSFAFFYCRALTSVTIPESVASIGNSAFYYCAALTDVYYAGSALEWSCVDIYDGNDPLLNAQIHFGKENTSGTCGENLTWTLTNDGVLEISGTGAMTDFSYVSNVPWYSQRSSIKRTKINSGVTTIGDLAFLGCTNLASVALPDSITYIGNDTFCNCSNLTSIAIPDSVASIGSSAFYDCTSLVSVTIPDSVTNIGSYAFYNCIGLTSITIPDSVTYIGDNAFHGCVLLKDANEFVIVRNILFDYVGDAADVVIPYGVTRIGNSVFEYCTGLKSVTIPDSVISIGSFAFAYCTSLASMTIPDGVTNIGIFAFDSCTSLMSVTIPGNVTTIDNQAFSRCTSLTAINVSEQNSNYTSEDGVLFSKDKSTLICCPGGKTGEYSIPESVIEISDGAFSYCTGLAGVTIPDSVTTIGEGAFSACTGLTNVTLPDSVTTIGENAFWECTGLTTVTIPRGVTSIAPYTFYRCSMLTDVYYTGTENEWNSISIGTGNEELARAVKHFKESATLALPAALKKIEAEAFEGVTAEVIVVPASVTEIGPRAFANCKNLREVIFRVDPNTVKISENWLDGCGEVEIIRP